MSQVDGAGRRGAPTGPSLSLHRNIRSGSGANLPPKLRSAGGHWAWFKDWTDRAKAADSEAHRIEPGRAERLTAEREALAEWDRGAYGRYYKKAAHALFGNVCRLAEKWSPARCAFFTVTFRENLTDRREASRRLKSIVDHAFRKRFLAWVGVVERQKRGAIHFHFVVVLPFSTEGCNVEEFRDGNYRSAPERLREEWAFWRTACPKYGFGRSELMPVLSGFEAVGGYLAKYVQKQICRREKEDVGARLILASRNARACSVRFQWREGRAQTLRIGMAAWAAEHGLADYDALCERMRKTGVKDWARRMAVGTWLPRGEAIRKGEG